MARFLAVVLVLAYMVVMTSAGWERRWHRHRTWHPHLHHKALSKKYERVLGGMTTDQVFRALDKNEDDFLAVDEWLQDGGGKKDFIELLDHADKNEDDKIYLAEFKLLKNSKAGQ